MEKANKLLESQKKLQDELAKERQLAVKKDFASQTAWNAEEFARNQAHEKAEARTCKKRPDKLQPPNSMSKTSCYKYKRPHSKASNLLTWPSNTPHGSKP